MKGFVAVLLAVICFSSCSLKYDSEVSAEDVNPEFVFYETKMTRYENNKKTAEVYADQLEEYKNSDIAYAKNVTFKTFDNKQENDTEGFCGLLYADTANDIYELYDGIRLFSKKNDAVFRANILRWNAASEQLTSGRTDMVRIEKDGTAIVGSGFSASGVSGKYYFTGSVSGSIETENKKEGESEKTE